MVYKILIFAPNWIGDAVMSVPLIKALAAKYTDKEVLIDVLAPKFLASIYKLCPSVNMVIEHNLQHKKINLLHVIAQARYIKLQNYHTVYILPNSFKSLLIPLFAGIKHKIAYEGEFPRKMFLGVALANHAKKLAMVKHYYALADLDIVKQAELYPKLNLDTPEHGRLSQHTLNMFGLKRSYVAIAIGAEYGKAKQWPLDKFVQLIKLILTQTDMQIVLVGSVKEKNDSDILCNQVQDARLINLCGQTSLEQVIYVVGEAYKLITHDSGLMHIACAIGTDVVAIYGSTSPFYTPPLSDSSKYIWLNLSCSPCFDRTCKFDHYKCLNDISPIQVFEKI